jgi:O-antigen/teichoic acid export membrane protein
MGAVGLIGLFYVAVFPTYSRLALAPRDEASRTLARVLRLCMVAATPAGVLTILFADTIVITLFKAQNAAAANPLRLLIIAAVLIVATGAARNVLMPFGHLRLEAAVAALALALNVLGCLLLARPYGSPGAALSAVTAELVAFIVAAALLARRDLPLEPLSTVAKPLAAGAVSTLAGAAVASYGHAAVVVAALGSYLLVVQLLGVARPSEVLAFVKALRRPE